MDQQTQQLLLAFAQQKGMSEQQTQQFVQEFMQATPEQQQNFLSQIQQQLGGESDQQPEDAMTQQQPMNTMSQQELAMGMDSGSAQSMYQEGGSTQGMWNELGEKSHDFNEQFEKANYARKFFGGTHVQTQNPYINKFINTAGRIGTKIGNIGGAIRAMTDPVYYIGNTSAEHLLGAVAGEGSALPISFLLSNMGSDTSPTQIANMKQYRQQHPQSLDYNPEFEAYSKAHGLPNPYPNSHNTSITSEHAQQMLGTSGYHPMMPYYGNAPGQITNPQSTSNYYQRGGYSRTGYKHDSPHKNRKYNIIPSNHITMQGVDQPLMLYGNGGEQIYAHPGEEHVLPNSSQVLEVPVAQQGKGFNMVNRRGMFSGSPYTDINEYTREALQDRSGKFYGNPYTGMSDYTRQALMGGKQFNMVHDPGTFSRSPYTDINNYVRKAVNGKPFTMVNKPGTFSGFTPGTSATQMQQRNRHSSGENKRHSTNVKTKVTQLPAYLPDPNGDPNADNALMQAQFAASKQTPANLLQTSAAAMIPQRNERQASPSEQTVVGGIHGNSDVITGNGKNPFAPKAYQFLPEALKYLDAQHRIPGYQPHADYIPLQLNQLNPTAARNSLYNQYQGAMGAIPDPNTQIGRGVRLQQYTNFLNALDGLNGQYDTQNNGIQNQQNQYNTQQRQQLQLQNNQYNEQAYLQDVGTSEAQRENELSAIDSAVTKYATAEKEGRNYNLFHTAYTPNYVLDDDGKVIQDRTAPETEFSLSNMSTTPGSGDALKNMTKLSQNQVLNYIQQNPQFLSQLMGSMSGATGIRQQGGKMKKYKMTGKPVNKK